MCLHHFSAVWSSAALATICMPVMAKPESTVVG
ncbi:hypothetical protein MAR_036600 [Mya arenaria]|uniref:Uncharacterized protein n=1 Tax=Mya arenaria TaxID=6604 RepID=A0ABY7FUQ6_MYAAR|nr:hypothetical protein MAR_036600 [Mya arenaria]